jgi:RNA polymerase-binding transcription factor DksA
MKHILVLLLWFASSILAQAQFEEELNNKAKNTSGKNSEVRKSNSASKMAPGKPTKHTIYLESDAPCKIYINRQEKGEMEANQPKVVKLGEGNQRIKLVSKEDPGISSEEVYLDIQSRDLGTETSEFIPLKDKILLSRTGVIITTSEPSGVAICISENCRLPEHVAYAENIEALAATSFLGERKCPPGKRLITVNSYQSYERFEQEVEVTLGETLRINIDFEDIKRERETREKVQMKFHAHFNKFGDIELGLTTSKELRRKSKKYTETLRRIDNFSFGCCYMCGEPYVDFMISSSYNGLNFPEAWQEVGFRNNMSIHEIKEIMDYLGWEISSEKLNEKTPYNYKSEVEFTYTEKKFNHKFETSFDFETEKAITESETLTIYSWHLSSD